MDSIEKLDVKQVSLIKNVFHGVLEGLAKSGLEFQPLAVAVAAEELASDIRNQSAQDFRDETEDRSYPEYIG